MNQIEIFSAILIITSATIHLCWRHPEYFPKKISDKVTNTIKNWESNQNAIIGVLLFLILAPMVLSGSLWTEISTDARNIMLWTNGVEAVGTVIDNEHIVTKNRLSSRSGGTNRYYSIVEFKDTSGQSHQIKDLVSYGKEDKGKIAPVYYMADDPSVAVIGGFWHNMFWTMVLCGGVLLGYYVLRTIRQNNDLYKLYK